MNGELRYREHDDYAKVQKAFVTIRMYLEDNACLYNSNESMIQELEKVATIIHSVNLNWYTREFERAYGMHG